jgi:hypothetical protein|tara:strand:+ start:208 stop:846 length:639 start_codon:yes stop_codon:yes gene_type:complete
MSRTGCLSDIAVKFRYPEYTPLSIDAQELMHPIHLQKNVFKGIKVPKRIKRFTDVSRFPVNDLKNFATFGSAGRSQEAQFYSIMAYRKELGSNNVMSNLDTAFQSRNKADYIPPPMFRPETGAGGVQAPATLSLGRLQTDDRIKNTFNLIASEEDHAFLHRENESHDETITRLNKVYRDDPEQLGIIERAWHQTGKQHLESIPMRNEDIEEE